VLLGPKVLDVTRRFAWLSGGHAVPPLWSLGYSGSTMSYTDAPNAQERMAQFVALCEEHKIPCSSFQMSSGYTSIGTKRYVFHWNTSKFPQPQTFTAAYAAAGLHLAANIKPCLLTDHPLYAHCAAAGLFLRDSSGAESGGADADEAAPTPTPETSMFWAAMGSVGVCDRPLRVLPLRQPSECGGAWWEGPPMAGGATLALAAPRLHQPGDGGVVAAAGDHPAA
jgi:alpha-glucosidase